MLLSLANLAVGEIGWASMWVLEGPSWKSLNRIFRPKWYLIYFWSGIYDRRSKISYFRPSAVCTIQNIDKEIQHFFSWFWDSFFIDTLSKWVCRFVGAGVCRSYSKQKSLSKFTLFVSKTINFWYISYWIIKKIT